MTPLTRDRAAGLGAFYSEHAAELEHRVARRVGGARAGMIEDACHTAWATLMRRPDIRLDRDGVGWLVVVATHEAWRLVAEHRELPSRALMAFTVEDDRDDCVAGLLPDLVSELSDPADRALERELHRERVARFATLKPAERQALLLKAAGYSYADIGALTGASYTAVNRRLAEGRARLRDPDRARR